MNETDERAQTVTLPVRKGRVVRIAGHSHVKFEARGYIPADGLRRKFGEWVVMPVTPDPTGIYSVDWQVDEQDVTCFRADNPGTGAQS